jgi:hypothetical protein
VQATFAPVSCGDFAVLVDIPVLGQADLTCDVDEDGDGATAGISSFALYPAVAYVSSSTASATVVGEGLTSTYGMPLVQYYTLDGTLVAQENATSVASNGASMQIPGFSTTQLPVGTYDAIVSNAASGGGYTYLGSGTTTLADGGVEIGGDEQSVQTCEKPAKSGCLEWGPTVYDEGTVSITVNGVVCSVSYGAGSTPTTLAIALTNAINSNSSINSLVYSTAAGPFVLINSSTGAQYSLSAAAQSSDPTQFPDGSFIVDASSSVY